MKQEHKAACNYMDKVKAYGIDRGLAPNRYPVIYKANNPHEWEAWIAYFRHIGMPKSVEMMEGSQTWTVPAVSPWDFDPTVMDAVRLWRIKQDAPQLTSEQRRAIAQRLKPMFEAMEKAKPEAPTETEEEKLDRLRREIIEEAQKHPRIDMPGMRRYID